jgi:vanillate O-demethylase monooxygenase subunit
MQDSISLKDAWYAVAIADQLGTEPVRREIFGEPVVLYRGKSGNVHALFDACPHRNAPLSLGKVCGDAIQCRYHGFEFDSGGQCTKVPGQEKAPSVLRARAYPLVERYGVIWLWPGDADAASEDRLVDWPWYSDPAFRCLHLEFVLDAPVEMAIDNLMDLTHVHFVHAFGVNLPIHASAPMKVSTANDSVSYTRDVSGGKFISDTGESDAGSSYMEIGGAFFPPSVVQTSGLTRDRSTNAMIDGPHRIILHGLTPEAPDRVRYIYVRAWNLYHSPEDVAAAIAEDEGALVEDKDIIEATYRNKLSIGGAAADRLVAIDEAAVKARRRYAAFADADLPEILR